MKARFLVLFDASLRAWALAGSQDCLAAVTAAGTAGVCMRQSRVWLLLSQFGTIALNANPSILCMIG